MCGVAGIVSLDGRPVRSGVARVRAVLAVQRHRGPDAEDVWEDPDGRAVLGNGRLAIVDPGAGFPLPMRSPDGKCVLSFNGEIYDHPTQRERLVGLGERFQTRTDTEVLLAGLRREGPSFLERLDGMWGLAFYDRDARRFLLARDLLGERQIFYWSDGRELVFASEAAALRAALPHSPSFDAQAAICALRFQAGPQGRTLMEGVRRLPPGHVLEVDGEGRVSERRLLRLQPEPWAEFFADEPTDEQVMDRLSELLSESVARRLAGEVPFAATLSGGIDSTLIAYFASQGGRSVRTIFGETRETATGRPDELEEYEASVHTARKIGSDHARITVQTDEAVEMLQRAARASVDGLVDWGVVSFEMLARAVRDDGAKVLLLSEGPDELAGGYKVDLQSHARDAWAAAHPARARALDLAMRSRTARGVMRRVVKRGDLIRYPDESVAPWCGVPHHQAFSGDFLTRLLDHNAVGRTDCAYGSFDPVYEEKADALDGTQRRALAYADRSIPDYANLRLDRGIMARSVEARTPHIAPQLAAFYLAMPARFRFREGHSKYILRRLVERLIGPEIAWRRKQGFSAPIWNRREIRDELQIEAQVAESPLFEQLPFRAGARERILAQGSAKLLWPMFALTAVSRELADAGAAFAPSND